MSDGSGHAARDGDEISVRYFRLAYGDHQIYEDRWREPSGPFVLGEGKRVEAWEEGLPGIRKGGRWELVVPDNNETAGDDPEIYVVEATSIKPAKGSAGTSDNARVVRVKGVGGRPKLHYPSQPPRHVIVRVLRKGTGPRPKFGDFVAARYLGGNPKTKLVQDFWSEESPYRFQLGHNPLAKAWNVGLKGVRLGERREFVVPSRLAYGKGMMVYVIELLEFQESKPGR